MFGLGGIKIDSIIYDKDIYQYCSKILSDELTLRDDSIEALIKRVEEEKGYIRKSAANYIVGSLILKYANKE